jgi:hypothetical protein
LYIPVSSQQLIFPLRKLFEIYTQGHGSIESDFTHHFFHSGVMSLFTLAGREINFELDVVSPTFEEYTFIYISYL